ncbi:GrpB family protein [Peribacillus acanthi]|uniref:GrpB family protein n=1 Tax=Peribacillus acanthi TaxID=2171554 RepID=UPI000D3E55E6|nr:GrpB family protein [Peribacillus acanthi]
MRKTKIEPWTIEWEKKYEKEEALLKALFKDELVGIYHIGSTSVPSIGYAKPIIDIMMAVKDISKVDMFNEKMKDIGYEPLGENGIPGRRYFPKGKDDRTHHLHIFEEDSNQIRFHLDLKNYLLSYPEEAIKYGELKLQLAKKFPQEHYKYQEGKQDFVSELAEKATNWASK